MNKKITLSKKFSLFIIVAMFTLLCNSSITFSAYAYSIGTDHGNSIINWINGDLDGDFTDNVLNASSRYGTMNKITYFWLP